LLVHKSPIDKRETLFALQIVRDMVGKYIYPIHRLDKPTSGILVFALNREVASSLSKQFMCSEVKKEYIAVVRGYTQDRDTIDYSLKVLLDKSDKDRRNIQEYQEAVTSYTTIRKVELPYPVSKYPVARYSIVKLHPQHGRKHQLRRHMKHIFHPIVGDTKYGRGEHNRLFREKFNCNRLLLHANKIEFIHPRSQKRVEYIADITGSMKDVLSKFGL